MYGDVSFRRRSRNVLSFDLETDFDIDLFDYVDEIANLYNENKEFRNEFDSLAIKDEETVNRFILQAKQLRKDGLLWERVKHDLREIVKEDYIVVL
jgi:hypothetical protein